MGQPLKSDLARVDAHVIQPNEYDEIPEIIDTDLSLGVLKRAGRPVAEDPRLQVTIRLPKSVLNRWKATGPGWQTRMAQQLATPKRLARLAHQMRSKKNPAWRRGFLVA